VFEYEHGQMFEECNIGTHGDFSIVCRFNVVIEFDTSVVDCIETVLG
jgi:hypothetical protein